MNFKKGKEVINKENHERTTSAENLVILVKI